MSARRAGLALALLGACADPAPAAAPLIPVPEFAAGAEMSAPRLSPDGTHLDYLTTYQGARCVAMCDVHDGHPLPILSGNSGFSR